jgi:hypothetical protein
MTDRFTAGIIRSIMIQFYKQAYGVQTERFYNPGQALVFENQVVFNYEKFQLPPELGGYNLAVFHDKFFDDKLSAMSGVIASGLDSNNAPVTSANRGRVLWFLDWSDFTLGVVDNFSVQRRTNEADAIYMYVPKVNIKHVQHTSTKWTPIIEDPNRHYIVQNFSPAWPKLSVAGVQIPAPNVPV